MMFAPTTYAQRRQRLLQDVGSGLVWLPGNGESPMNYGGNPYPFRQDSTFLYFFGLDRPGLHALLDADTGKATLFADDASMDDVVWIGPQPTAQALAAQSGTPHVAPTKTLPTALVEALRQKRTIHYLPPYRHDTVIYMATHLGLPVQEVVGQASRMLIHAVVSQRMHKSEEEIVQLTQAVNLSGEMHKAVMDLAKVGMKEAALVAAAESLALGQGSRMGYHPILTTRGQTLHNHYHGHALQPGQLVLADMGAECPMHYTGDITRTFPVSPTFTPRQREVYEVVLAAETQAIAAIRPDTPYLDIHLLAARIIAEGLKGIGILQGSTDDIVTEGAHALFFPHGLGHALGLDVHDMEGLGEDLVGYDAEVARSTQFGLNALRLGRRLQPGFVLTVEPGIYFIPELIRQWQQEGHLKAFIRYDRLAAYTDFGGIRIEDNVLVTHTGHEVLGNPIPKSVAEVEGIRGG